MQKFNYTIPNHIDNAEKEDGPSWDFGIGGQSYIIGFKTPPVSSDIINHMITSFEIKK